MCNVLNKFIYFKYASNFTFACKISPLVMQTLATVNITGFSSSSSSLAKPWFYLGIMIVSRSNIGRVKAAYLHSSKSNRIVLH